MNNATREFEWSFSRSNVINECTVDWDEDALVSFSIKGSYRKATLEEPAEHRTVELESVIVSRPTASGRMEQEDILDELTDNERETLEARAYELLEED